MEIGIVGVGVVGGALLSWFEKNTKHTVRCVDPGKGMHADLSSAVAVFVAVPVPTKLDDEGGIYDQDMSCLMSAIDAIRRANTRAPIFIRSTVLPGTCDRLAHIYGADIFAAPEFLTERQAAEDVVRHPIVAGCADDPRARDLLSLLFPEKELIRVSNVEAESGKYLHNIFGALKVGYFNIWSEWCERSGANYENVLKVAGLTGFIEKTHTQVPGPDGSYGFGGKCFPKDLRALIGFLYRFGLPGAGMLTALMSDNFHFRKKTRG